jgi:hypothetical protein
MSPDLAVAVVELRLRNDRLARQNERPVPPSPFITALDRYDELCRRLRVERGQS